MTTAQAYRLPGEVTTELDEARQAGDPSASRALDELGASAPRKDLLEHVRRKAAQQPGGACAELIRRAEEYPPWVDFDTMQAAGRLYCRHLPAVALVLGCASLIASFTSALGNKVLVRTGRLSGSPAGVDRRLAETFSFLHAVCERPETSLRARGPGAKAALSVRLLHERVRRHCHGGGWPTARLGAPVNQEDMLGTLMAFSVVVLSGLRMLGVEPSKEEEASFMHVWQYTGYLMGVDEGLLRRHLASLQAASAANLAIIQRNCQPDEDSQRLVSALLRGMTEGRRAHGKPELPLGLVHAVARYLLGDTLADALKLRRGWASRLTLYALLGSTRATAFAASIVPQLPAILARRNSRFAARAQPPGGKADFAFRTEGEPS